MRIFGTSDYAVSEQGDFTVLQIFGLAAQNKLYLLDQWRGRTSSAVWVEQLFNLHQKWKPIVWAEESGVIQKAIEPAIKSRARQLGVYPYRNHFPRPETRLRARRASEALSKSTTACIFLARHGSGLLRRNFDVSSLVATMIKPMH